MIAQNFTQSRATCHDWTPNTNIHHLPGLRVGGTKTKRQFSARCEILTHLTNESFKSSWESSIHQAANDMDVIS